MSDIDSVYSSDADETSDVDEFVPPSNIAASLISKKSNPVSVLEKADSDLDEMSDDEGAIADDEEEDGEANPPEDDGDASENIMMFKKKIPQFSETAEQSESESEDENEDYLKKFNAQVMESYISTEHPECLYHNLDEIIASSQIVRDSDGNIIDDLHKTMPFITKFEISRILGQRAKQINIGSKPFVNVPKDIIDGYIIAEMELREKKIPFIIKRPLAGGGCEYWRVKDLENINF